MLAGSHALFLAERTARTCDGDGQAINVSNFVFDIHSFGMQKKWHKTKGEQKEKTEKFIAMRCEQSIRRESALLLPHGHLSDCELLLALNSPLCFFSLFRFSLCSLGSVANMAIDSYPIDVDHFRFFVYSRELLAHALTHKHSFSLFALSLLRTGARVRIDARVHAPNGGISIWFESNGRMFVKL